MQEKTIARGLLKDSVLNSADAARLILEMQEMLGSFTQKLSRRELLLLMRKVVKSGVNVLENEERTVPLATAAWASVESKGAYLRPVSLRDLRYYVRRLLSAKGAGELNLRNMSSADCRRILMEAFGMKKSAYVKARAILHGIFAYGIRREWCDSNPVARIEVPRVQENTIEPLTIEEVERLRNAALNSDMRLSLYLMLYSGIRPTEVSRLRISDICWKEQLVIIRPNTSKTGGGRVVPLRGCQNLPLNQRVIPRDWYRRWHALRQKAGFTNWRPDACRHTFASYHAAFYKNLPVLQLEMGHGNLDLLRARYMRPVIFSSAQRFWQGATDM